MNQSQHGQWSSRSAFILATTGAAVGLGNIWKFPYMVGSYGGSAFMVVYLICIVLIGLPIMIAEILIGRQARQNSVSALNMLACQTSSKQTSAWRYLGWWGSATLILVLSFYNVIAGWSLGYAYYAISGHMKALDAEGFKQLWQHFSGSPVLLIFWHSLFMLFNFWIVKRGVKRGLEQATHYMMPALLVILVALVVYASQIGDFQSAWNFLFNFHPKALNASVTISAMGHAFFTLAIGAGCLLTYGCYLGSTISIIEAVVTVAALDVLVALLSGMAIFPIIFHYHLPISSGPGLMFLVLPVALTQMPAGQWVAGLFFILMALAALTSTISLAEPPVVLLMEHYKLSRTKAITSVALTSWIIGLGSALSFNRWHNYKLMHWTFFDASTDLATNIMLPIGGLGFCLFAGWIMPKKQSMDALQPCPTWLYRTWLSLIRYVAPVGILIILIASPF